MSALCVRSGLSLQVICAWAFRGKNTGLWTWPDCKCSKMVAFTQHEKLTTGEDFASDSLGCEPDQRGKLWGEKARSCEVFQPVYCKPQNKVYCSGLVYYLVQWIRHQGTTAVQIKFYGQYDSQSGVSAASTLFIGCKAVKLLGCECGSMKIKGDQGKHGVKITVIKQ